MTQERPFSGGVGLSSTLPLFRAANADARRQCLEIIMARGADHPASLAYLVERTGLSERAVKDVVEQARKAGKPIGSRRGSRKGEPAGYYYAATVQELEDTARPLINQAKSELYAASRLLGRHRIAEWCGQLQVELSDPEAQA